MSDRRRGLVLVLVLWLMVLLGLMAFTFGMESRTEARAGRLDLDSSRARGAVRSGLDYARAVLVNDDTWGDFLHDVWADDPDRMQRIALTGDDGPFRGVVRLRNLDWGDDGPMFSLLGLRLDEGAVVRVTGMVDEAARLDLNSASAERLSELPMITDEVIDGIVDWRDEDDEPELYGAESTFYSGLPVSYLAKDAPFETVEELAMVVGVTPEMLYGEDRNRNGRMEDGEDLDGDGLLDPGLVHVLTVHARDLLTDREGEQRLDLNSAGLPELSERLGDVFDQSTLQRILQARLAAGGRFLSPVELVSVQGVGREGYARVADRVDVSGDLRVAGRININTAPREVLLTLPLITEDNVDAMLARRDGADDDALENLAWPLDVMPMADWRVPAAFATTRSHQFAVEVTGRSRGVVRRYRFIVDRTYDPPKILHVRDLSPWGDPWADLAEGSR